MKYLYWAFAAVLVIAAVLFALSNRVPIDIGIWPLPFLSVPTYGVVLGAFALGFLSGAFMFWLRAFAAKARAKSTGRRADRLQRELDTLQTREEAAGATAAPGSSVIPAAAPPLQRQPGAG